MLNSFFAQILNFQQFIYFALPFSIVIGLWLYITAANASIGKDSISVVGLFLGLSNKDTLRLSLIVSRFLFIFCCVVFTIKLNSAHLAFFIFTLLFLHVFGFKLNHCLFDILYSGIIYGALMIFDLLIQYIRNVRSDEKLLAISILLGVFIILFSLFNFFKSLGEIVKNTKLTEDSNERR